MSIEKFKLKSKGDSAVVRLLHTSVNTISNIPIHTEEVHSAKGISYKNVKCLQTNCPLCNENHSISNRIYLHIFDYTDNKEKVWDRTDKIIEDLKKIEENWGNLNDCVVKITRDTQDFPTYTIDVVNAAKYPAVDINALEVKIDEAFSYRYYMTRSKDELEEYLATKIMPEHKKKPFTSQQNSNINTQQVAVPQSNVVISTDNIDDDPFI